MNFLIDQNLQQSCASEALRKANKGLLILGSILSMSTIAYFWCKSKCSLKSPEYGLATYLSFTAVLGAVLMGLGIVISTESKNTCASASHYGVIVLALGGLMFGVPILYGGMQLVEKKAVVKPTVPIKPIIKPVVPAAKPDIHDEIRALGRNIEETRVQATRAHDAARRAAEKRVVIKEDAGSGYRGRSGRGFRGRGTPPRRRGTSVELVPYNRF